MGKFIVTALNVNCASAPIFIPAADPKHNHAIVTVIANRGKTKAGVALRSEVTLNVWGKYAQVAACHLDKGRQINVVGELLSHTVDTGTVDGAGKKVMHRRNEIRVDRFWFGGDTLKELTQRISKNLIALQAAGQPITPDALLKSTRNATVDYNPALAAQTGMYGNSRVWVKGQGFLKAGAPVQNAPVMAGAKIPEKTKEELMAELAALEEKVAGAGAAEVAAMDVFGGAR